MIYISWESLRSHSWWLLLFATTLFLSGCSSLPKDRLVKNIREVASKEHNISHGELLAKYNLVGFSKKNTCLFAKNYGDIVNVESYNKSFIKHIDKGLKNNSEMTNIIANKIHIIHDRLSTINTKYNILSKSDIAHLKILSQNVKKTSGPAYDLISHHDTKHYDLSGLSKANIIVDNIPIFIPLTESIMTSKFGKRKLGKKARVKFHAGIDLAGSKYANIYAAANGVVLEVAASPSYGNFILLEHKKNIKTRYAHLQKLYVSRGEKIFQGQVIGKQGSTGHSTSDHLHFEILYQNYPIDPMGFVGQEYSCVPPSSSGLRHRMTRW